MDKMKFFIYRSLINSKKYQIELFLPSEGHVDISEHIIDLLGVARESFYRKAKEYNASVEENIYVNRTVVLWDKKKDARRFVDEWILGVVKPLIMLSR